MIQNVPLPLLIFNADQNRPVQCMAKGGHVFFRCHNVVPRFYLYNKIPSKFIANQGAMLRKIVWLNNVGYRI